MSRVLIKSLSLVIFLMLAFIYSQSVFAANFIPDSFYQNIYAASKTGINARNTIASIEKHSSKTLSTSKMANWTFFKDPYNKSSNFFKQPTGIWLNGTKDDLTIVERSLNLADNEVPVFVIYFIPTKHSFRPDEFQVQNYLQKNKDISKLIGDKKAVIILEPDALCSSSGYTETLKINKRLIKQSVEIYKNNSPSARVYIDAGHSNWHSVYKMTQLLKGSGIDLADGFATNISNFQYTRNELQYARSLSKALGEKRFIIDTSRNGNGPGSSRNNAPVWSDPIGVSIGTAPTTNVNYSGLDAFLWIKPPGEADGSASPAGSWHPDLINFDKEIL